MSVAEQMIVLLALTSGLMDNIPVEKIQDAEDALLKNITQLSGDIVERLFSNKQMTKPDRETILGTATRILEPFQDKPPVNQIQQ